MSGPVCHSFNPSRFLLPTIKDDIINPPEEASSISYRAVEPHIWLAQIGSVGQRSDDCNKKVMHKQDFQLPRFSIGGCMMCMYVCMHKHD